MKTFVFAIGGTGARVLRALTMVMAMDVKVKSEIIPIIIDMDTRNGDALRTLKLLDNYRVISEQGYSEKMENGFFINKLGTLGSVTKGVDTQDADFGIKDSFQLDFGDVNHTFHEYVKGNQLSPIDNDLLESLFNNSDSSNPGTELHLKLNHGFKGNPNIGSVVFNNIINTPEFQHFENVFNQDDRIFVISSIFGGTGSSGFPQLIKNLRNSNNQFIKNAVVGAVVVKPYFRVKKDANSSINSDTFNSKTKSALTYYASELNNQINSLYYLADKPGRALENNMGGNEQKNNAHLIELLAAKAILNFTNQSSFTKGESNYYEYGIKDLNAEQGVNPIGFADFYREEDDIWERLAKFTLFAKLYKEGLHPRRKEAFYIDLDLNEDLRKKYFFITLTDFIDHYWGWLKEMELSERSFSPFNLDRDFSKLYKGMTVKALDKTFLTDHFTKVLNGLWNNIKTDGKISNEEKFLKMMYSGMEQVFEEKVRQLPTRA